MATLSPPQQATTSTTPSVSSLQSYDDKASPPAASSVAHSDAGSEAAGTSSPPLNGTSNPQSPPKRPTLSNRLTRMFSKTTVETTNSGNKEKVSGSDRSSLESATRPTNPEKRPSISHTLSTKPNGAEKTPTTGVDRKKESDPNTTPIMRRFALHPDGSHEHTFKNDRRQEKLSTMFKNLMTGKKDPERQENQLSLVSSWVDQVKSEKLANDQKGGPNCANTLVEKYGKCHEVVGRGAFGIVRISHKTDNTDPKKEQLYAVKEFRRRPSESSKKYNKRLTSEFCISSALRHPNVIHTLDLMKDAKGDFCEVMEFCAGGDLYTLVLAASKLEVIEADCLFKQLMQGVEYIHEMGVAHRDLKPENLLLTTHGSLKITDFGNGECFRMAWEKEPHMVAGLCGSAPYIAPEEYVDQEFDPRAVDVWACGVIYMAMRTGRHLWRLAKKDDDEFYEKYLQGRRDEDGYGPIETLHRARCRNVIYSILDPNPSRRLTASQVLKSEWGREIKLCKAGEEGF